MIPAQAVEAAMKHFPPLYHSVVIAALESAAPYMPSPDAASVWDEAVTVLYRGNAISKDHLEAMWASNPYRPSE